MEDITFSEATGQGSYVYTPEAEGQTKTEFTSQINSQNVAEYVDDHVEKTIGVYTFTKDTTIKHSEFQGAIRGDKDPVTVNAEGKTLTIESSLVGMGALTGIYHYGTGFASSEPSGDLNISTATLNLNIKGKGGRTFAIFNAGNGLLRIKGQTNIDISGGNDEGDEVSGIEAISKGTTILEGLTIRQAKSTDDHRAINNKGLSSKIYVNVDEAGNVGSHKVDIQGNVLTNGHQALTNVALTTADSKLHGIARVQSGTLNLWLQNGATWMNENYGTGAGYSDRKSVV